MSSLVVSSASDTARARCASAVEISVPTVTETRRKTTRATMSSGLRTDSVCTGAVKKKFSARNETIDPANPETRPPIVAAAVTATT